MKVSDSSKRLKELMVAFRVSQQDISNKTGINKASISRYVNGTVNPKQESVMLISNAYGVDPMWLMGYDISMFGDNKAKQAERDFDILERFHKLSERDQLLISHMIDKMLGGS